MTPQTHATIYMQEAPGAAHQPSPEPHAARETVVQVGRPCHGAPGSPKCLVCDGSGTRPSRRFTSERDDAAMALAKQWAARQVGGYHVRLVESARSGLLGLGRSEAIAVAEPQSATCVYCGGSGHRLYVRPKRRG
ncbi:MAG: hypothetical protein AAF567_04735 [Actinomycetota bacterium]